MGHLMILVPLLLLFFATIFWVRTDASARGQNGGMWAVLTFLFWPIALVAWLHVRRGLPRRA